MPLTRECDRYHIDPPLAYQLLFTTARLQVTWLAPHPRFYPCGKLTQMRRGEVAERLKAAVC
jgi:hypothetical protein